MTAAYVAVAVGVLVLLTADPTSARAGRVMAGVRRREGPRRGSPSDGRHDPVLAAACGAAAALLVGGSGGWVAGALAATGAWWALRRGRSRSADQNRGELERSLPLACDLLAACVAAGASQNEAVGEVARVVPGALGELLRAVVRSTALGVPVDEAWAAHTGGGPAPLRTVAAALARSATSGASPGPVVEALAADQRERQRLAGEAAARRAGVLMVAPLGLCFLPAFVLIGVVPLVAGLIGAGLSAVQ